MTRNKSRSGKIAHFSLLRLLFVFHFGFIVIKIMFHIGLRTRSVISLADASGSLMTRYRVLDERVKLWRSR